MTPSAYVIPGLKEDKNAIAVACSMYNVTKSKLLSDSRKREIVVPRQILMYYYNVFERMSLSDTGALFGKDHATVLHAKKSVKNMTETDKMYKKKLYNFFLKVL